MPRYSNNFFYNDCPFCIIISVKLKTNLKTFVFKNSPPVRPDKFFLVEIMVQQEKRDLIFGPKIRYLYIAVELYEFLMLRHNMSTTKKLRETYNETQHKIVQYLNSGITLGKHYFKSKYIAKDLGLSPKEVGTNMAILADNCKELDIIRWSYSNSTTWMVTPRAC